MSEVATVTLALAAIIVPVVSALFWIVYSNIKESVTATNVSIQILKNDFERDNKDLWDAVNKVIKNIASIDTGHKVLCQKHEDEMNDHVDEIAQHKLDISRLLRLQTDYKKEIEGRITTIENSIRTIVKELGR